MRLWLDDVRPAPEGWVAVSSVDDAIEQMRAGQVTDASLDHDLGDYAHLGGDGYRLVMWMAEHDTWPSHSIAVHSANPVGRDRMLSTIDTYGPYPPAYGMERRIANGRSPPRRAR